jgi:DNA-binding NarL/FixJ family response regulator
LGKLNYYIRGRKAGKLTKVFIIDQQPLFRQGIRTSLSQMPDIEVSGEADVSEEVLSTIETSPPDVVLLGADASFADSLKLCHIIKQRLPSVATAILASQLDDQQLLQAIKAQAAAYLSRDVTVDELTRVVRRCAGGEHPINESLAQRPKVAEQILEQFRELSRERDAARFISPLTPRETEVLNYMAQGYLNKQIAQALNVSEQTIKNHVTSILRKLNANARTQAVIIAVKKGLVSLSEE